jgi:hypothetical protein
MKKNKKGKKLAKPVREPKKKQWETLRKEKQEKARNRPAHSMLARVQSAVNAGGSASKRSYHSLRPQEHPVGPAW